LWGSGLFPVSDIQWNGLTHVIDNAALINSDGTLNLTGLDFSTYAAALVAAAHANNVKALVQLEAPYGTESYFNSAVTGHLSALVANVMTVVNTYGFDGVDIDIEPPNGFVYDTTGGPANMTAFAAAMRTALGGKLFVADTLNSDYAFWATLHSTFDRINVMTYDLTGTWNTWDGPDNGLWYDSALHSNGADSVYNSLDGIRALYVAAGVPAAKLALGLAFYGWKWTGGVLASDPTQGISGPRQAWQTANPPTGAPLNYNSVLPLITGSNYHWDPATMVPYINYLGSTPSTYWYLTYDNPQSIQAKVQYIIAQGLGGWIMWHLSADYGPGASHPHPLLDAVQAGSAPTVLSGSALGSGTVGTVYSASLSATGAAPLQWSLSSGRLPSGLSLSSTGVISGTPTSAGTSTFIVTVGNFAGSSSQPVTITIATSAS
jgi:chitinase